MSNLELYLEAERRGLLPPDKAALLGEMRKRGMIDGGEPQQDEVFPDDGPPPVKPGGVATPIKPRFGDFLKPIAGGRNPVADVVDDIVDPFIPDGEGRTADEQAWLAKRGLPERAADAASFAASLPVRMVTGGRGGLGDVVEGLGAPEYGAALKAGEQDFVAANRPQFEALANLGDAAMGSASFVPKPSMPRVPRQVARMEPVAKPSSKAEVAQNRIADVQGMDDLGVPAFGPALSGVGSGAVAKQMADTVLVGGPLRNKVRASVAKIDEQAERIASGYGSAKSENEGGAAIQGGVERFADAKPSQFLDENISSMSDADLSRIIVSPARATSFPTKAAVSYEKAWRLIPEQMREGRAVKGQERFTGGLMQTRGALDTIYRRNLDLVNKARAAGKVVKEDDIVDIAMPFRGGVLGQAFRDIMTTGNVNRTLKQMRLMRTEVRRLASGVSDTEKNTMTVADLEGLQRAITGDMVALLETAAKDYAKRGDAKNAANISRAVQQFRRSDQFYAVGSQMNERLKKITKAKSPEIVWKTVANAALKGGKGDVRMLKEIKSAVLPSEWNDAAASIIRHMGEPLPSARGMTREQGFSLSSFTSRWNAMDPKARDLVFKGTTEAGLAADLDKLARVAGRFADFEALANNSKTATNAINAVLATSGVAALASAVVSPAYIALAAVVTGLGYATSKFLASRAYVRWLTRAYEIAATPKSDRMMIGHLRELIAIAKRDPEIGTIVGQQAAKQIEQLSQKERVQ